MQYVHPHQKPMTEEEFEAMYGFLAKYAEHSSIGSLFQIHLNIDQLSEGQLNTLKVYIESCCKKNECQYIVIYNISSRAPESLSTIAACINGSQTKCLRLNNIDIPALINVITLLNEDSVQSIELSNIHVDRTPESIGMVSDLFDILKVHQKNITSFFCDFDHQSFSDEELNYFSQYLYENKKLTEVLLLNTPAKIDENSSLLHRIQKNYENAVAVAAQHPALKIFGLKNCKINEKILQEILSSKNINTVHFIDVDFSDIDDKTLAERLSQLANHPTITEITFNNNALIKNEPLFRDFVAQSVATNNKIVLCSENKFLYYNSSNNGETSKIFYSYLDIIDGAPIENVHDEVLKHLLLESTLRYLFKHGSNGRLSSNHAMPVLLSLIKKYLPYEKRDRTVVNAIANHLHLFTVNELKDVLKTMGQYDLEGEKFLDVINVTNLHESKSSLQLIFEKVTPDELFELYFTLPDRCSESNIMGKFDNITLSICKTDLNLYRNQFVLLKIISDTLKEEELLPQDLDFFGMDENQSQEDCIEIMLAKCKTLLVEIIKNTFSFPENDLLNHAVDDMLYYLNNPSQEEYVLVKKMRVLLWVTSFFNQMTVLLNQRLLEKDYFLENDFNKLIMLFSCLKELSSYADPEERIRISNDFIRKVILDKRVSDFFFSSVSNMPKYKIIPAMELSLILSNALEKGSFPAEIEEIEHRITSVIKGIPQFYKHGPRAQLLVKGISSFSQLSSKKSLESIDFYTQLEIIKLVLNIKIVKESPVLNKKKKVEQFDNQKTIAAHKNMWLALAGLFGMKRPFQWSGLENIELIYKEIFMDFLMESSGLDQQFIEDKMRFYKETFGQKELATGLLAYWEGLKTLDSPEFERLFMRYIMSVLSERSHKFYALRYKDIQNEHLSTIFLKYPALHKPWVQWSDSVKPTMVENLLKECEEIMTTTAVVSIHQSLKEYFKEKIINHRHLGVREKKFPAVIEYLKNQDSPEMQSKIFAEVRGRFYALKEIPFSQSGNYYAEKEKEQALIFQYNLLKLLEEDSAHALSDKQRRNRLGFLTRSVDTAEWHGIELVHDLTAIEQKYKVIVQKAEEVERDDKETKSKQSDYSKLQIALEDDYWGMFMCGTEVAGSCQRIYGSPELNRCLLAYVLDGKNKMIAIRDEAGNLKARAILRLMLTDEGPALLKESNYPQPREDETLETVMDIFALKVAETLQLSLFSKESLLPCVSSDEDAPIVLYSLPSGIPAEYVDSNYSQEENGEFAVSGCRCLFKGLSGPELEVVSNAQALQLRTFMGMGGYVASVAPPNVAMVDELGVLVLRDAKLDPLKNKALLN